MGFGGVSSAVLMIRSPSGPTLSEPGGAMSGLVTTGRGVLRTLRRRRWASASIEKRLSVNKLASKNAPDRCIDFALETPKTTVCLLKDTPLEATRSSAATLNLTLWKTGFLNPTETAVYPFGNHAI